MSGFPCLARTSSGSGLVRYSLGDRLVDRYLEFVAGRCRPDTLRAVAFDLKAFFAVVGKDPVTVTAADVFDFLADQRGDRTVIRLSDRESGLSVTGSGVAPHARSRRPPITRWSISVLLDHRLCSDQPFRRFPGVHVMLSILREPGGGAAGVWGRQPRRHDPTGKSGRDLQPQRRAAAARFRRAPSCAAALLGRQHCRDCSEGRSRSCDQNDLPAGHAADDHGVDHDRSGVASAAWFRRRQWRKRRARLRRTPGQRRPAQSRRRRNGW